MKSLERLTHLVSRSLAMAESIVRKYQEPEKWGPLEDGSKALPYFKELFQHFDETMEQPHEINDLLVYSRSDSNAIRFGNLVSTSAHGVARAFAGNVAYDIKFSMTTVFRGDSPKVQRALSGDIDASMIDAAHEQIKRGLARIQLLPFDELRCAIQIESIKAEKYLVDHPEFAAEFARGQPQYLDLVLDAKNRTLSRLRYKVLPIDLSDLQFRAMSILLGAAGNVVTKDEFTMRGYSGEVSGLPMIVAGLRRELIPLDVTISTTRWALKEELTPA